MDPKGIKRPPVVDENDPHAFKIQTGRVKATEEIDQATGATRYFIEGTASSSVRDRGGDTLTDAAQLSMLDQCKDLTMWLNHSYKVPEDILGTCGSSELVKAIDPKFGECVDLVIRCEVYGNNPRAMDSYNAVKGGIKLAYSIGGYFRDIEFDEDAPDEYWWPLIVNDIELLEISLVGIPANPRAYTKGLDSGFVPYMIEPLRERVKNAGATREERYAFVKSLTSGSERTSVDPIIVGNFLSVVESKSGSNRLFEIRSKTGADLLQTLSFDKDGKLIKAADEDTTGALSTENQIRCVEAMKSMKSAYGHGMCTESAAKIKDAHAQVKAMMPDDYEYDDTDDPSSIQDAAPTPTTCSTVLDAIKALEPKAGQLVVIKSDTIDENGLDTLAATLREHGAFKDVVLLKLEAGGEIEIADDELARRRAELETISSTAAQRAAEVTEAEAKLATLRAEETTLQEKIEQLAATPLGRLTAKPGGSYNDAPYQRRTSTPQEARKLLGAALSGAQVGDPAMRPA